jgi:aminopeptidase N
MRRSDFHYSQQAYGVASYPKPASILVALRGVLGEDVFWDAYHTFIREWAYKHPYPWDMFNTYERVSGMDLSWFWRSWYFETWMLNQVVHSVEVKDGDTVVTIRDYGDVPMPVLLRAEYADGTVIDKRVSHEVWLTGTRETTIILPGTGVQRVSIDPDRYFPDVERHSNTWPRITN